MIFGSPSEVMLLLIRMTLGWYFAYEGFYNISHPPSGLLELFNNAQFLPEVYNWLTSTDIFPWIQVLLSWGWLAIGICLIFGLFIRVVGILGAVLQLALWVPTIKFPVALATAYVIDTHVIFALILLLLVVSQAGNYFGLDSRLIISFRR